MKLPAIVILLISLLPIPAFASDNHHGLMIKEPIIRATTPSAGATAGYLVIHNHTKTDDRLIAVKADFARKSEIHEMKLVGDVMKMRQLEGGLLIPAGGMALLEKGGNHLMFMGLNEQIKHEENYEFTLVFEKAGEIKITADTISLSGKAASKTDHDHSGHDHSGHKH